MVSTYLIWISGSLFVLSDNQSSATPVGTGHMSHRRTSAFIYIHLDHCFVEKKRKARRPKCESFAFVVVRSTLINLKVISVGLFLRSGVAACS